MNDSDGFETKKPIVQNNWRENIICPYLVWKLHMTLWQNKLKHRMESLSVVCLKYVGN